MAKSRPSKPARAATSPAAQRNRKPAMKSAPRASPTAKAPHAAAPMSGGKAKPHKPAAAATGSPAATVSGTVAARTGGTKAAALAATAPPPRPAAPAADVLVLGSHPACYFAAALL